MDAYQVLGLRRGASEDEVKAAYRALAQKYNPDNYEAGPLKEDAQKKMDEINAAFDEVMAELRGAPAHTGDHDVRQDGRQTDPGSLPEIRALIQQGRVDEARSRLQAMPDGPASAEWNFLMGSAYYYKGWLNEALRYFQGPAAWRPPTGSTRRRCTTCRAPRTARCPATLMAPTARAPRRTRWDAAAVTSAPP